MKPRTSRAASPISGPQKIVHLRIDPHDETIVLEDVLREITNLQRKHPDREVSFDGKEYAIVSKPRRERTARTRKDSRSPSP